MVSKYRTLWLGVVRLGISGLAILLAACTYSGGIGDPVTRKLSWFSYVGADDIQAKCTPTSPDQYRLVYNANWNEQVRAYDLRQSVIQNGGAMLFTEVFGGYGADVAKFSLSDPVAPARGSSGTVRLSQDQFLELVRAIDSSGFGQPAPEGLRLESWDFYWVVAACRGGQFHFNAWRYPSDRYDAISFDKLLFAADGTGVPVNPPRHIDSAEQSYLSQSQYPRFKETGYSFELMVGKNGLANRLPLF